MLKPNEIDDLLRGEVGFDSGGNPTRENVEAGVPVTRNQVQRVGLKPGALEPRGHVPEEGACVVDPVKQDDRITRRRALGHAT
jgi:hypothetical protein